LEQVGCTEAVLMTVGRAHRWSSSLRCSKTWLVFNSCQNAVKTHLKKLENKERLMNDVDRRTILATGALALAGAAAQSGPAGAQAGSKALFPVPMATIPIVGETDVFPVRRIYCIGRNYAAHSREMGSDPTREPPFFFQKPTDAIQNVAIGSVADHPYPSLTKNYHYEVELVAALKSGGANIPAEKALDHVYGYALGLDMTRRDLQRAMGDEKKPWEIGKSFDRSAVLGPIHPVAKAGHFTKGAISLAVNDTVKQNSNLQNMIWSVAEQIAKLSEAFELKAGDIIYSGTPENVGPVVKDDVLLCKLEGLPDMSIRIT
jgi:fumarylpyruvate hydrolase